MLIASAACAVTVVAWTLIYFRPTVASFLEQQGGNAPAERLNLNVIIPHLDIVISQLLEASQRSQRVVIVVKNGHLHFGPPGSEKPAHG